MCIYISLLFTHVYLYNSSMDFKVIILEKSFNNIMNAIYNCENYIAIMNIILEVNADLQLGAATPTPTLNHQIGNDLQSPFADHSGQTIPPIYIINEFSMALYTEMAKHDDKNLFISPFSIHVVLFLASFGAAFNTLEEMRKTMKVDQNKAKYKTLLERLGRRENLKLVSGMFVDSSFGISHDFINDFKNLFTYIQEINLRSDPNAQRQYINNLVSGKTDNKIVELFPEGSIHLDTILVLASAMYFKCAWAREFKSATDKTKFWNYDGQLVETKMMVLQEDLKYYHDPHLNYGALQLPYEGTDYSMIILLPDKKDGLKHLDDIILSSIKISRLLIDMKTYTVDLRLPRFKIERSMDMENTLTRLGCQTMFTEQGKFSEINIKNKMWVDKFMHKACIDIDEKGTGGGQSKGVAKRLDGGPSNGSIVFNADHPFLFFIISDIKENDKIILFAGRIKTLELIEN